MNYDYNPIHLLRAIRLISQNIVNAQEKLLLFILLSSANENNDSWNSHDKLVQLTGLGLTSVKKYLKSLKDKNLIIIKRPDNYFNKQSNHYSLNIDQIMFYFIPNKSSDNDQLLGRRGRLATVKGSPGDCLRGRQTTTKKQREETKEEGAYATPDEVATHLRNLREQKPDPMPQYVREMINKMRPAPKH